MVKSQLQLSEQACADVAALMTCFTFLGPSINKLSYWDSTCEVGVKSTCNTGQRRKLCPLDEFFLVLTRLRLGLFEQDIAYR